MALSDDLIRDSRNKAAQKVNNIEHFKTQILLTDAEKELYDEGIVVKVETIFGLPSLRHRHLDLTRLYQNSLCH